MPALPDTERATEYTILVADTGPYDVGFDIYGDGTDYANWIEVWDDDQLLTPVTDWVLDSPSGSLSTLARPITNARVTFTADRSGVIRIQGARRPRRVTQFTNGAAITANNLNQAFNDAMAISRELWDRFKSVLRLPPGEEVDPLPRASSRAGSILGFDYDDGSLRLFPFDEVGAVTVYSNVYEVKSAELAISTVASPGPAYLRYAEYWNNSWVGEALVKKLDTAPDTITKVHLQTLAGDIYELVDGGRIITPQCIGAKGDGIQDDWQYIQDLIDWRDGGPIWLMGEYRISDSISRIATADTQWTNGLQLYGFKNFAQITADFNGGPIIILDAPLNATSDVLSSTRRTRIDNVWLRQEVGRTGVVGIMCTGAWYVELNNIDMEFLSSHGIYIPLRPDLDETSTLGDGLPSDYYQCYDFSIIKPRLFGCSGHGIYNETQSPGSMHIYHPTIQGCGFNGIYLCVGQLAIENGLIGENGLADPASYGGVRIGRGVEGASRIPYIRHVEFDLNRKYHLLLEGVRGGEIAYNRFLTQPVALAGAAYSKDHVIMGNASNHECWDVKFIGNFHRTPFGADWDGSPVTGYKATGNNVRNIRIEEASHLASEVDTFFVPYDTGLLATPGLQIMNDGILKGGSKGNLVVEAQKVTPASIGTSLTTVVFETEIRDTNSCYDPVTGAISIPIPGDYEFNGTITVASPGAGDDWLVGLYNSGSAVNLKEIRGKFAGAADESIPIRFVANLASPMVIKISAQLPDGAKNTTAGGEYNYLSIKLIS